MKYTIEIDVKPGRCYMLLSKFLKALKLGGYRYSVHYKESTVDFEKIICDEVSKELGIDIMPIDLLKDVNKSEIVCARQICMVYRNKTMSLRQSAMPYNRNHATTLHSKEVLNNRYKLERSYREMIQRIEARTGKKLVENI